MKTVYLALAILVIILQEFLVVSIVGRIEANPNEIWQIGKYLLPILMVDFAISAAIFLTFIQKEAQKYQIKNLWIYLVSSLTLGFCFTLPLFLYIREGKRELVSSN